MKRNCIDRAWFQKGVIQYEHELEKDWYRMHGTMKNSQDVATIRTLNQKHLKKLGAIMMQTCSIEEEYAIDVGSTLIWELSNIEIIENICHWNDRNVGDQKKQKYW